MGAGVVASCALLCVAVFNMRVHEAAHVQCAMTFFATCWLQVRLQPSDRQWTRHEPGTGRRGSLVASQSTAGPGPGTHSVSTPLARAYTTVLSRR
jgi:hypothetical protein